MKQLNSNTAIIEPYIKDIKKPTEINLDYIKTDESLVTQALAKIAKGKIQDVAVSQIPDLKKYIMELIKLYGSSLANKPIIINFTKSGVGKIVSLGLTYTTEGYQAVIKSLPGAAVTLGADGMLVTLGAPEALATIATTFIGVAVTNEYDKWKIYSDNLTSHQDDAKKANLSGQLLINSGTDDLNVIKAYLNSSAFLELLVPSTKIVIKTPTTTYEIVRSTELDNLLKELKRRGYTDADIYHTNPLENITLYDGKTEIKDRICYNNGSTGVPNNPYFLVKKDEKLLMPINGNSNNNEIHLDDVGRKSEGAAGNDTIYGGKKNDTIYGYNDDNIQYPASDQDYLVGNGGNDEIHGGIGNDSIYGDQESNVLSTDGNDILYGDNGNDYIVGGGGNDIITGGKDKDSLYSGTGLDTYIFSTGDGQDIIFDQDNNGQIKINGKVLAGGYKNKQKKIQINY